MIKKRIAIFGSTGSIGTQALQVIRANPDLFEVEILTAQTNDELLLETTADTTGEIGVLARDSVAPSLVVVSWVKVWGK